MAVHQVYVTKYWLFSHILYKINQSENTQWQMWSNNSNEQNKKELKETKQQQKTSKKKYCAARRRRIGKNLQKPIPLDIFAITLIFVHSALKRVNITKPKNTKFTNFEQRANKVEAEGPQRKEKNSFSFVARRFSLLSSTFIHSIHCLIQCSTVSQSVCTNFEFYFIIMHYIVYTTPLYTPKQ